MTTRESLLAAALAAAALAACAPAKRAEPPVKPAAPPAAAAAPAAPIPAVAPAAMPAGRLTKLGGIVVARDLTAHSLTIKDYHGRTRTFRVAGAAKLTKGGDDEAIALDALSAGDRVRLEFGGDVAASVHVKVAAAN